MADPRRAHPDHVHLGRRFPLRRPHVGRDVAVHVVGAFGVLVAALHDGIGGLLVGAGGGEPGPLAQVLYTGGAVPLGAGGPRLVVLYSLVPWVGSG